MNRLKKLAAGLAIVSLAASPVMAQTAQRSSAPTTEESDLDGTTWFGIIAAAAVVVLAIIAATNGDDDPVSA